MGDLVRAVMADRFIAPIWRRIGRASRARDWPRAIRLYRAALRRVPNAPEIWVQYGHALSETGDVAGAEAAYRRATVLAPRMGEWHLFLGQALVRQGRMDEARAALLSPSSSIRRRCNGNATSWRRPAIRRKRWTRTGGR